ncbi:MAG: hypothetical protein ACO3FI_01035 [Cyclobacteriaceae bacterium]
MAKQPEQTLLPFLQNRWILFAVSVLLLSTAYLLKQWPLFSFIALIPCFALTDLPKAEEKILEVTEILLFIFGASLFVAFDFDLKYIFAIVALAGLYTLPFVLFLFSRKGGGPLTGHFLILIYWLAGEYVLLKLLVLFNFFPTGVPMFSADMMAARPEWFKWNAQPGYLAVSTWILASNWIGYRLISKPFNVFSFLTFVTLIVAPIGISYFMHSEPIIRDNVFELYRSTPVKEASGYAMHGEWIGRTCVWVSVLVLSFSFVRLKTKKK